MEHNRKTGVLFLQNHPAAASERGYTTRSGREQKSSRDKRTAINADYEAYRKSPHWFALRAKTMILNDWMCCICGIKSRSNEAHHIQYRDWYSCVPADLRVLCRGDHGLVHAVLAANPDGLKDIKSSRNRWARTMKLVRHAKKKKEDKYYVTENRADVTALCRLFGIRVK